MSGCSSWGGETSAPLVRFAELVLPFAHSVHVKARAIETLELSSNQLARLKESMLDDLKKCSDVLIPDVRQPLVSRAAADLALPIPVDLLRVGWHDQPRFDRGRKSFHWEHVTPLAQLRDKLAVAETVEQVQGMITAQLYVAWITKNEDQALTAAGFKSKRPRPWAAYESAGIELLDKPTV